MSEPKGRANDAHGACPSRSDGAHGCSSVGTRLHAMVDVRMHP